MPELISAHLAVPAVMAFLKQPELFHNPTVVDAYQKYVISQRNRLLPKIFECDYVSGLALLSENKKILPEKSQRRIRKYFLVGMVQPLLGAALFLFRGISVER